MNRKKIWLWAFIYFSVFIIITGFYNMIWAVVVMHYNRYYTISLFKKYNEISMFMAAVSTLGFYLKVRMAKKNNRRSHKGLY